MVFEGVKSLSFVVVLSCCERVDQHAEMVRQKLEKVDVGGDIQAFISACGTGTDKPGSYLTAASCGLHIAN